MRITVGKAWHYSCRFFSDSIVMKLLRFLKRNDMTEPPTSSDDDLISRLKELAELHQAGHLTDNEYQRAKTKLLEGQTEESAVYSLGELLNDKSLQEDKSPTKPTKPKRETDGRDRLERVFEFIFRLRHQEVDLSGADPDKLAARYRFFRLINSVIILSIVSSGLGGGLSAIVFLHTREIDGSRPQLDIGIIGTQVTLLIFGLAPSSTAAYTATCPGLCL
jgi:hypothetical protein